MCGIAGILNYNKPEPVSGEVLSRMGEVIHHRGPDESGVEVMGRVGFAHARLSIIDLSHGQQPMFSADGKLCITYNGEIYNYPALRADLQAQGYEFRTNCDTEVILYAYRAWGEDCVNHLQGMFAFAIWDKDESKLFLARDRVGIKPLYFCLSGGQFLFASEIKSLFESGIQSAEVNAAVIPEYLANRFVAGGSTFYKNIESLPPGHTMTWRESSGFDKRCYWKPPVHKGDDSMTMEEAVDLVRNGLQEAVDSHLLSDVPLGVFLSGGIDSSVLASMAAKTMDEQLMTFSVGFKERAANELEYARLVAESINADHHEIVVSPEDFFGKLPKLVWNEDEPIAFTSSVPLYYVSELAAEHVKVVLTGEGADELFLGYNKYRMTYWNDRLGKIYRAALPGSVRGAVKSLSNRLPGKLRRYSERSFLSRDAAIEDLYFDNFSVFSTPEIDALLQDRDDVSWIDPYARVVQSYEEAESGVLESLSYMDMQNYLVELLMKQDQMSMAASIESRVPFLDHKFVEMASHIPSKYKLRGTQTKAVLREAVQGLVPEAILTRPKMGFPVPIAQWLAQDFSFLVDEFVTSERAFARGLFKPEALNRIATENSKGIGSHGERLWLLLNLEIWQRIFIDGEEPESIMPMIQGDLRNAA